MADEAKVKGISIYPNEQFIVTTVARLMFDGNESQAIRHMIRAFGNEHLLGKPDNEPSEVITPQSQIAALPHNREDGQ